MRAETAAVDAATPSGDPLMSAKLRVAEIRSRVVARQRLLDRLRHGARGPLTLVSAPAGSGKTVLASSWVSAGLAPGRVTWITLDSGDDRPGIFWTYVLEGLARSGVQVGAVDRPARAKAVDRSLLIRLSACLSEQPEPSVLVLDNVEKLGHGRVVSDIEFLIQHSCPQLRVVAISRMDPPLPLHRYRLSGWATEIRLDELAFTVPETQALLAEHGAQLAQDSLALLAERTEGWAAGLRLAAISLQDRSPQDGERIVHRFGGGRRDVAEYFLAEVLDFQPPGIREFMLSTCVVDTLRPELADELSGRADSARVLRALASANAFVEQTDDGGFRYHPLFRDLLRAQLDYCESSENLTRLHRKAARWLVAKGQVVVAAGHSAMAGDWKCAATLVVEELAIGGLLAGTDSPPFAQVFQAMPGDVGGPHVAILRAALAMAAKDDEACAYQLSRARESVDNGAPEAGTRAVRLSIAALETLLAGARADVDRVVAAAATVEELAADGEVTPANLRAVVAASKGGALLWAGELEDAEDTLVAAAQSAEAGGLDRLRAHALGQLALLNAVRGRLRRATKFARLASRLVGEDRPPAVDAAFAWIYADEYDVPRARQHMRANADHDDPVAAAALAVVRGRLLRRCVGLTTAPLPPWLTSETEIQTLAARVNLWLRKASQELDRGRNDLARHALEQALQLAAPENLRRPIVEAPPRLRRFLRHEQELVKRHLWLGSAIAGTPTIQPASAPATLIEPLTDREHEVLCNMAALLSNDEIAQKMFVSVNTVKTHIRGILRKLSANRRNEAIRRACELGLLRVRGNGTFAGSSKVIGV